MKHFLYFFNQTAAMLDKSQNLKKQPLKNGFFVENLLYKYHEGAVKFFSCQIAAYLSIYKMCFLSGGR